VTAWALEHVVVPLLMLYILGVLAVLALLLLRAAGTGPLGRLLTLM
jgi:hypothetical protein